jgi:hypothetical protein
VLTPMQLAEQKAAAMMYESKVKRQQFMDANQVGAPVT